MQLEPNRYKPGHCLVPGAALGAFIGLLLGKFAIGFSIGFFVGILIDSGKCRASTSGEEHPSEEGTKA